MVPYVQQPLVNRFRPQHNFPFVYRNQPLCTNVRQFTFVRLQGATPEAVLRTLARLWKAAADPESLNYLGVTLSHQGALGACPAVESMLVDDDGSQQLIDLLYPRHRYNEYDAVGVIYDVARALSRLHAEGHCHLAVHLENIYVEKGGRHARLLDFEFCVPCYSSPHDPVASDITGFVHVMEHLLGQPWTQQFIAGARPPFRDMHSIAAALSTMVSPPPRRDIPDGTLNAIRNRDAIRSTLLEQHLSEADRTQWQLELVQAYRGIQSSIAPLLAQQLAERLKEQKMEAALQSFGERGVPVAYAMAVAQLFAGTGAQSTSFATFVVSQLRVSHAAQTVASAIASTSTASSVRRYLHKVERPLPLCTPLSSAVVFHKVSVLDLAGAGDNPRTRRRLAREILPVYDRRILTALNGDVTAAIRLLLPAPWSAAEEPWPIEWHRLNEAVSTLDIHRLHEKYPALLLEPTPGVSPDLLFDPYDLLGLSAITKREVMQTLDVTVWGLLVGAILGDASEVVAALMLLVNTHLLADWTLTPPGAPFQPNQHWIPQHVYRQADFAASRSSSCSWTPAHIAAACGHTVVVTLLFSLFASVDGRSPHTAPTRSAEPSLNLQQSSFTHVRLFAAQNELDSTVVDIAASAGNTAFLTSLVDSALSLRTSSLMDRVFADAILTEAVKVVFMEAANFGLKDVLLYLLNTEKFPAIPKAILDAACTRAIEAGNHNVYELFAARGAVPDRRRLDGVAAVNLRRVMDAKLPLTEQQQLVAEQVEVVHQPLMAGPNDK
jgi:hypothetical protein